MHGYNITFTRNVRHTYCHCSTKKEMAKQIAVSSILFEYYSHIVEDTFFYLCVKALYIVSLILYSIVNTSGTNATLYSSQHII